MDMGLVWSDMLMFSFAGWRLSGSRLFSCSFSEVRFKPASEYAAARRFIQSAAKDGKQEGAAGYFWPSPGSTPLELP